jgi:hypothetical protein
MDHIITADDSEEIEIHSKWLDWTWTMGQLFQQLESKMVTTAINKLRTKISDKFDAEILLHELEIMTKEAKENPVSHWTFTTPGAMIGGQSSTSSYYSVAGDCRSSGSALTLCP